MTFTARWKKMPTHVSLWSLTFALAVKFYVVLDLFNGTRYTLSAQVIREKAFGELVSDERQKVKGPNMGLRAVYGHIQTEKVTISGSVRGKLWGVGVSYNSED